MVIRPEDLDITPAGEGKLDGLVTSVIFKGVHWEMDILANGYEFLVHSTDMAPIGTTVGLTLTPDDIHIMFKGE